VPSDRQRRTPPSGAGKGREIEGALQLISTVVSDYLNRSADQPPPPAPGTMTKLELAQAIVMARRQRASFLPSEILGEPGYDMLLDLYISRMTHKRVSVSSLCIASGVPSTTALRWISILTGKGYFARESDPSDGRRYHVTLTDLGFDATDAYLAALQARLDRTPGPVL